MVNASEHAEQLNLHQDIVFAENFFKTGVWTNEWTGYTSFDSTTPMGRTGARKIR